MSIQSDLIEQCEMWCTLAGVDPEVPHSSERWWIDRAVADYKGDFAALNGVQRQMIAGLRGR